MKTITVGDMKAQLANLDDDLEVIIAAPVEDEDGDTVEQWFSVEDVKSDVDSDTAKPYARVNCVALTEG